MACLWIFCRLHGSCGPSPPASGSPDPQDSPRTRNGAGGDVSRRIPPGDRARAERAFIATALPPEIWERAGRLALSDESTILKPGISLATVSASPSCRHRAWTSTLALSKPFFYVVGQEETSSRKNPAARVTDLLQEAFGH